MKQPQFSVIIPTLNEEIFLPKLLSSLVSQTVKDFEVIVVDGSSSDKTVSKARQYAKKLPSCRVIVTAPSLPLQRNVGAREAHGTWLIFVDADSIMLPYALERMQAYINETTPKVFSTWAMPDSPSIHDSIVTLFANIYFESAVLMKRPLTPGPMTVIRCDVFHRVGGYDESHRYNEDVDLGLRLAKKKIILSMLRETCYVWSMRRIRREGKVKVINQYILSMLPIMILKRPFKHMPGYFMGGQMYGKKKIKQSVLQVYERKLKAIMRDLFD